MRDYLAEVTPEVLAQTHPNPWAPGHQETTLSCLHVILEEEWEHHRFAVRDLDAIEARGIVPVQRRGSSIAIPTGEAASRTGNRRAASSRSTVSPTRSCGASTPLSTSSSRAG